MKTYILSGGKSSRMGTDKGLVQLHQKPLISYLIETLQKLDFDIKIIAHHSDYHKFNLEVIKDIYPEKGPLGGVFTALNDAQTDCFIISVDTPFITEKQIAQLLENHQKNQLTLAFSEDKIYPLFGIYPFHLFEKLKENILQNQLKLMKFVDENSPKKIEFNFSSLEKQNINTFEELKKQKNYSNMEIKTFGKITEIVNKEIELLFPMNLAELKTTLEEQFPLLKNLLYSIAINDELISDEDYMIIKPQSIALMPPFFWRINSKKMQRYSRQIILPNFGNEAQNLLAKSKVLVVGAGGLGVPVLQYLAAAGVGKLGIADGDKIEISNLQRQVLYNETELGKNKAQVAKEKITKLNSTIELEVYDFFIDTLSIFKIITDYDVVVDCTDHFSIRYLLNDVCYLQKKPLVFASIYQFEAQLSVFHYGENPYNLRDVFSEIPNEKAVPNCNEAGVIGTHAGITGSLQANEVIKIITKIGVVNSGKLLLFNSLINQITQLSIFKNEKIFLPTSKEEILQNNYGFFCADEFTVENIEILEQILNNKNTALVDVREKNELPKITTFPVLEIPLSDLPENMALLQQFDALVFICKSGIRSKKAVLLLQEKGYAKPCYSVQKGVEIFKK